MRPARKKAQGTRLLPASGLVVVALLSACDKPTDTAPAEPPAQESELAAVANCSSSAHLATELFGSIERKISWSADELSCESMLRPDGKGVRLRFTGGAADRQLAIILALPDLQRGATAAESPTVVTLTVEGSGRFFSTPTSRSCWSDIEAQDLIDGDGNRYDIRGTLYCVTPLGEINGTAAITIPKLEFRGVVDWDMT